MSMSYAIHSLGSPVVTNLRRERKANNNEQKIIFQQNGQDRPNMAKIAQTWSAQALECVSIGLRVDKEALSNTKPHA